MDETGRIEERVGSLIIEAQRHELWVRSESDDDGIWHNALLFRRDGIHSRLDTMVAGVDWHVPPGDALLRAIGMTDAERIEIYLRALKPRPPLA